MLRIFYSLYVASIQIYLIFAWYLLLFFQTSIVLKPNI